MGDWMLTGPAPSAPHLQVVWVKAAHWGTHHVLQVFFGEVRHGLFQGRHGVGLQLLLHSGTKQCSTSWPGIILGGGWIRPMRDVLLAKTALAVGFLPLFLGDVWQSHSLNLLLLLLLIVLCCCCCYCCCVRIGCPLQTWSTGPKQHETHGQVLWMALCSAVQWCSGAVKGIHQQQCWL